MQILIGPIGAACIGPVFLLLPASGPHWANMGMFSISLCLYKGKLETNSLALKMTGIDLFSHVLVSFYKHDICVLYILVQTTMEQSAREYRSDCHAINICATLSFQARFGELYSTISAGLIN